MSAARSTSRWGGAATAVVLGLALVPGGGPAMGAVGDMTVVEVSITPPADDVADGFATVEVEVALRSTTPLPDELSGSMNDEYAVLAEQLAPVPAVRPASVTWKTITRVSGTSTDGVWRGQTEVSPIFAGSWTVTRVRDYGTSDEFDWVDTTDLGAGVDLGRGGVPPWQVAPAPLAPVRVVTGLERWTPRARVTERATGAGIAAFWLDYNFYAEPTGAPAVRLPSVPQDRADAQGYLTLSPVPVAEPGADYSRHAIHAYGGRGSRGASWEAATALWPQVKWQANQRFAVAGRTVAASGNAWPAPAVYDVPSRTIHLQQLVGRTWRTVATGAVRDNGRYTLTWTAPTAGAQVLRVYKPGGGAEPGSQTSVGTALGSVTVTTR